jgi:hypothetical protein
VAEREGFEPPVRLRVLRISSAARSTTLPPLRGGDALAKHAGRGVGGPLSMSGHRRQGGGGSRERDEAENEA